MTLNEILAEAIQHHQAGRLAEAEARYRLILKQDPRQSDALYLLGLIAHHVGKTAAAVELIELAIQARPDIPAYRKSLGQACERLGQWDQAIAYYQTAIALQQADAEAHYLLGSALGDRGRLPEAIAAYEACVRHDPRHARAHSELGQILLSLGRVDDALASCHRAVACDPQLGGAHNNLGNALRGNGRLEEAIAAYRNAVALAPSAAEMWSNLGVALNESSQRDEAETAFRRSIALQPQFAAAHFNLGNALKEQACVGEAIEAFRRAVELVPQSSMLHPNLLLALHYDSASSAADLLREHRIWAERHAEPLRAKVRPHRNSPAPDRRLRVGYVSPDMHEHPVARFLLPLLQHHDRTQFEIFCYASEPKPDAMTARLEAAVDRWKNVNPQNDAALADLIRDDEIDILVDLAAHTGRSRLLAFARKPAPVQVTYLAYCSTTGLEAIDYRFSDHALDPVGSDLSVYTEQTMRLPDTYWCYAAPDVAPEPGNVPSRDSGIVTFGCLNNSCKLSPPLLRTWSRLLATVPQSRLLLHVPPGSHRTRIVAALTAAGADANRVSFVAKQPMADYFQTYRQIDIALDTFPFAGGTTTCDALWMGVPVVTLRGRTAVGRSGASLLAVIGLPELVTESEEEYLRCATELAGNAAQLAALRHGLRTRMQASPLMDAERFTRAVETAYREMWRKWCAGASR